MVNGEWEGETRILTTVGGAGRILISVRGRND